MHWLYQQGLEVVGGDLAPEAGRQFSEAFPDLRMKEKTVSLASGEKVSLFEVCSLHYCRLLRLHGKRLLTWVSILDAR